MAKLLNNPFLRFFTTSGTLAGLSGGKLYTYTAGTTTPKATYTDSTEGTPHANPIVLDSNGIPSASGAVASIWLATGSYKLVLKDSSDNTIQTVDNVTTTGNDENIVIQNSAPSLTITDTDGTLNHIMKVTTDTLTMENNSVPSEYLNATETVATFGYSSGSTVIRGPSGISITGVTSFTGAGSLRYGSMYQHETEDTITINTQNVFEKITGLSAGLTSTGVSVATSAITAPAGVYKVDYSITLRALGADTNYGLSVFVNGVEQEATSTRQYWLATTDFESVSGGGLIDVTDAAHEIDLRIKNITDTSDIKKTDVNFTIVQVGAT